jgi:hypothetical protein
MIDENTKAELQLHILKHVTDAVLKEINRCKRTFYISRIGLLAFSITSYLLAFKTSVRPNLIEVTMVLATIIGAISAYKIGQDAKKEAKEHLTRFEAFIKDTENVEKSI